VYLGCVWIASISGVRSELQSAKWNRSPFPAGSCVPRELKCSVGVHWKEEDEEEMWQPGLQFGWAWSQLLLDALGHGQGHELRRGKATTVKYDLSHPSIKFRDAPRDEYSHTWSGACSFCGVIRCVVLSGSSHHVLRNPKSFYTESYGQLRVLRDTAVPEKLVVVKLVNTLSSSQ
jgi:hypothetical protein